jgi:hypothetical protein
VISSELPTKAPGEIKAEPTVNTVGLSQQEINARIEKARSDEKAKAYARIEALQADKKVFEKKLLEAETSSKSAQEKLNSILSGESSEVDTLVKELNALKEQQGRYELALESVATDSAEKIGALRVEAHREKVLREHQIELVEFVQGNTIDEINASVQVALDREKELRVKFAGGSLAAQGTPAASPAPTLPKADTSSLPKPLSIESTKGLDLLTNVSPLNRHALTKLPKEQYLKIREQILAEAKRKSGMS